jgi:signal transduction histidine kinase
MKPEADAHGCRIDYRVTAPVPIVLADALQLQLVMVNLLRNAMEAAESQDQNGDESVSITVGETADVERGYRAPADAHRPQARGARSRSEGAFVQDGRT